MKILMVTNKVKTFALGFQNVLEPLNKLGHEVVWAADFSQFVADKSVIPCLIEQIDINTSPFNTCNIKALRQIMDIIRRHNIEGILCSTPIGGLLARMAAFIMNVKPVVYEAHGFLFFKGAPLINQTVYKWEELLLSWVTDCLITITEEDYKAAQKFSIRNDENVYMVHGAGVNVGVRVDIDKSEKRRSIGVPEDAFVIISAGELNKNKNTEVLVRALKEIPDVHYIACGVGPEKDNLIKLAKTLGVTDRFHLMGYRTDVAELMAVSDAFAMMSFREGMPRALLEAMDLGLPCVGSDTRGIRDLIDRYGGFICSPKSPNEFANAFKVLKADYDLRHKMGEYNRNKVNDYSADVVKKELFDIYIKVFGDNFNGSNKGF